MRKRPPSVYSLSFLPSVHGMNCPKVGQFLRPRPRFEGLFLLSGTPEASPFFPFRGVKVDGGRSKCLGTAVRNLPRPRQSRTWSQSAAVKPLLSTQTLVRPSLEESGGDSGELPHGSLGPLALACGGYLSPPSFTTRSHTFDVRSTVT